MQRKMQAGISVKLSDVTDATVIGIWKHIYSFLDTADILNGMLVCSAFSTEFRSLVTHIDIGGTQANRFGQRHLLYITANYKNVQHLRIAQECSDSGPALDFTKVKLPALKVLSLNCKRITRCAFNCANTPQLERATLNHTGRFKYFDLDLPHLTAMSFDCAQVDDPTNFGPSLNRCPKLEMFSAYKLWGLSGAVHKLHLPECTSLDFHRSDDLEALELRAPKLAMLNLRGCYALELVKIMPDPPGTTPTPLTVNLINANIDRGSKQHLKQHPRVKAGAVWIKESQEWGGLAAQLGLVDDDFDRDSDDDQDGVGAYMSPMQGGSGPGGFGFMGASSGGPTFPGMGNPAFAELMMNMLAQGRAVQPGHLGCEEAAADDGADFETEDGSGWETMDDEEAAAHEAQQQAA